MYEVSSEIYAETDFKPSKCANGRILSNFRYFYPTDDSTVTAVKDEDGDFNVSRRKSDVIQIEHSGSTVLKLVGLQVWRGALLLADFIFENRVQFAEKQILELGAGVGLTSIAAGVYAGKVICTDVNLGGILELIKNNVQRNRILLKGDISVEELDFKSNTLSESMQNSLKETDVVIAADVIYDDDLTDCFISLLEKILDGKFEKPKTVYIALEKRYVFTIADLETVAPCFEYFQKNVAQKPWVIENIPINFKQYFVYERCKDLVLLKVTRKEML